MTQTAHVILALQWNLGYVQVGTQKFGRRTERDVQVKIIFGITPCNVFWMRVYQSDVQTSGTYNWETYNWDFTVDQMFAAIFIAK